MPLNHQETLSHSEKCTSLWLSVSNYPEAPTVRFLALNVLIRANRTPELQKSEAASKNTAVIWYIKNIFIHEQNLISSMTGSWDSVEARTPDLCKNEFDL